MPMRQLCEFFLTKELRWFLIDPDEELLDYSFIIPITDIILAEYYSLRGTKEFAQFFQKEDFIGYEKLKQKALITQIQLFRQIQINEYLDINSDIPKALIKQINDNFLFESKTIEEANNTRIAIQTTLKIAGITEEKKEEKHESWEELVVWVHHVLGLIMPDDTSISKFCHYYKTAINKIEWQKSN